MAKQKDIEAPKKEEPKKEEPKNLAQEQMAVEAAKFELPFGHEHLSRDISLPSGYGKDRIIVMVRDPWWIFTYWEITMQRQREVGQRMQQSGHNFDRTVLRIYDVTDLVHFDGTNAHRYFDIALRDMAKNWYIDVFEPNRRWCIEIGMVSKEGGYFMLARSNIVKTPRFGMSDILDEMWMASEEEYWWLFGASGGFDVGKSSLEMKELFQKYFQEWISSGALFSMGSQFLQQARK